MPVCWQTPLRCVLRCRSDEPNLVRVLVPIGNLLSWVSLP